MRGGAAGNCAGRGAMGMFYCDVRPLLWFYYETRTYIKRERS